MREAFAHTAVLTMTADDERAPGAAITLLLCGDLEHDPPCPLAAHHTAADRDGGTVRLRVLFATEPGDEARVRARIDAALSAGEQLRPDGVVAHWQLLDSGRAALTAVDTVHAERLCREPQE